MKIFSRTRAIQNIRSIESSTTKYRGTINLLKCKFSSNAANAVIPEKAQILWKNANAVCFDVDCTITNSDSLDLLAEYMGVGDKVAEVTNKAMDGSMTLENALDERLQTINCTPKDIKNFLEAYPPEKRFTPKIKELIKILQARGVSIYLISGGFRELILPIANALKIPKENVYANRMNWQWDDETNLPSKLVGFDMSEPTAHNQGKPEAIGLIRSKYIYNTVVMIGDGITDLEAVEVTGGADLFIGYGGVIERKKVKDGADWYIYDYGVLIEAMTTFNVAMIGSGAWACAALSLIAQNCISTDTNISEFSRTVKMWVYEEEINGQKLTDIINQTHENPKYLPGYSLGENVVASSSLVDVVKDADVLVFCMPHQFIRSVCQSLIGKVKPNAIALSLMKGMSVASGKPQMISQIITKNLKIDCSVLMGANLAMDVVQGELTEAVIGYNHQENALLLKKMIERESFLINVIPDIAGAEMCGTLKNIVAMGVGMVDGLGLGHNSKATILTQGLHEMKTFSLLLNKSIRDDTFLSPCGIADLVATSYGGRNQCIATEYTKRYMKGDTTTTFNQLEKELLNGQKLQGTLTSMEVQEVLKKRKIAADFPLFTTINRIITGELPPTCIVKYRSAGIAGADADADAKENHNNHA